MSTSDSWPAAAFNRRQLSKVDILSLSRITTGGIQLLFSVEDVHDTAYLRQKPILVGFQCLLWFRQLQRHLNEPDTVPEYCLVTSIGSFFRRLAAAANARRSRG